MNDEFYIFNDEFYICQVLRWNPSLGERVCSWLGIDYSAQSAARSLGEFIGSHNLLSLSTRLGCSPSEVFTRLKERLARELALPGEKRYKGMAPSDLSLFLDSGFTDALAEGLGYSTGDRRE